MSLSTNSCSSLDTNVCKHFSYEFTQKHLFKEKKSIFHFTEIQISQLFIGRHCSTPVFLIFHFFSASNSESWAGEPTFVRWELLAGEADRIFSLLALLFFIYSKEWNRSRSIIKTQEQGELSSRIAFDTTGRNTSSYPQGGAVYSSI